VALIALATVMIVPDQDIGMLAPGAVYGQGLGRFLTVLIGEDQILFATTFGAMAFSTFVFDTLDVSTRLGRYILQELFGRQGRAAAVAATAITCGVPLAFILLANAGAWRFFWTLFGTSNQLLAALSLLGITVWLKKSGRRYWYTLYPMLFVSAVTVSSLVLQIREGLFGAAPSAVVRVNGVVSLVLLGLASTLFFFGVRALRERGPSTPSTPSPALSGAG
jgi:carbon starvation protein